MAKEMMAKKCIICGCLFDDNFVAPYTDEVCLKCYKKYPCYLIEMVTGRWNYYIALKNAQILYVTDSAKIEGNWLYARRAKLISPDKRKINTQINYNMQQEGVMIKISDIVWIVQETGLK